jgi:hypothetical protein
MSKMKSTLAATLLTLVFAFPTVGGIINSPGSTPPPPPPTSTQDGGTGSPGSQLSNDLNSDDLSSAVIVDILTAVLAMF